MHSKHHTGSAIERAFKRRLPHYHEVQQTANSPHINATIQTRRSRNVVQLWRTIQGRAHSLRIFKHTAGFFIAVDLQTTANRKHQTIHDCYVKFSTKVCQCCLFIGTSWLGWFTMRLHIMGSRTGQQQDTPRQTRSVLEIFSQEQSTQVRVEWPS